MPSNKWLAESVFAAIQSFDETASFCDVGSTEKKNEDRQAEILRDHLLVVSQGVRLVTVRPRYTGQPSKKADLAVESAHGDRIVCELKGIYKTWCINEGVRSRYYDYLFAPFKGRKKQNSAGHDLWKLANYAGADTTHVAQILIGSAMPCHQLGDDFAEYAQLAQLDREPWISFQSTWTNPQAPDHDYEIRVWICEWKALSE
jgi:hypothetical protein